MHAYLITGGDTELRRAEILKRLAALSVSEFDTIYLRMEPDEEHIGIGEVRAFKKRLLLSPQHSTESAGVIESADLMTTEAQNALLKLLEEPPPNAIILCETENRELLLPTVVSRCEVITMKQPVQNNETQKEIQITLMSLLSAPIGKRLAIIDALPKDRTSTKQWVSEAIAAARLMMLRDYQDSGKMTALIRLLNTCQKELAVNVNPRLTLDTVFLAQSLYPSDQSGTQ